jgi:hypothetical protein
VPAFEVIQKIFCTLPQSRTRNLPATLFVVSGPAGPRWILPAGPNLNPVLANWSPYGINSQILWRGVQVAQRVGLMRWLPRVQRVHLGDLLGIDWQALGWKGSAPPVPVIYVGTPGPQRKAAIHLVDPASGDCPMVVKVPLQLAAQTAILREAAVLTVLAEEPDIAAPQLIHVDEQRAVATQRFVTGRPGSRRLLPDYQNLLRSLVLLDEHTTLAGQAESWQYHPLWDYMEAADFNLLAAALAEQADTRSLPSFWVHGDFAPWNIRHRRGLTPALIDWEQGQRGGLPLQDAFHFLHIQDFLFRERARAHFKALEPLAQSLGISSEMCTKLEIAYLSRSYFTCMEWGDRRRADYLLKSLKALLPECGRSSAYQTPKQNHRLHLVTSRASNYGAVRGELFSCLIAELNRSGIPYCILSGYLNASAINASDIDVTFCPRDLHRVPELLARCAASAGAHLVQSLRHETSACYFVLAKTQGKHITHLAVDCYGDYRRKGRSWLKADDLLTRRRPFDGFYLPSIGDEFTYRLVKLVLKQSLNQIHLKHLQHLFARDAAACQQAMATFWPATAAQIEKAVVEQDFDGLRRQLRGLAKQAWRSKNADNFLRRTIQGIREIGRVVRRILLPTGMHVRVSGDSPGPLQEVADRILCSLEPAFRRSTKMVFPNSVRGLLPAVLHTSIDRMRSTVIVETVESGPGIPPQGVFAQFYLRLFSRPDLTLNVRSERSVDKSTAPEDRTGIHRQVTLDSGQSPEAMAEQVNLVIVDWLEARTRKRLHLRATTIQPLPRSFAQSAGNCDSAGLD